MIRRGGKRLVFASEPPSPSEHYIVGTLVDKLQQSDFAEYSTPDLDELFRFYRRAMTMCARELQLRKLEDRMDPSRPPEA